jgi:hypothetical protein
MLNGPFSVCRSRLADGVGCISKRLKKSGQRELQCVSQLLDGLQRRISISSFNASDTSGMQSCAASQLLLGNAAFRPPVSDGTTKSALYAFA